MRQSRDPRLLQCARSIHWCPHLPKKTTRTPPLDRQNASKAPQLPHSECPKCPQTVSSSPREATKATTKPNAATTTSIQVTEAPQFTPTHPLSITTPTPAGRARPARQRRASGPELGGSPDKIAPSVVDLVFQSQEMTPEALSAPCTTCLHQAPT